MSKVRKLQEGSVFDYVFFCDGCGCAHGIRSQNWIAPGNLSEDDKKWIDGRWTFNSDLEKPTISPSIHVWDFQKDANGKIVSRTTKCHSFVTEGKIQYLGDCNHPLANQTVDLPEF